MTNVWDDLADNIILTDDGSVLYDTRALSIMRANGIDKDALHTAIEGCSGVDQGGIDWIDWDAVQKEYAAIVAESDAGQ